MTLVVETYRGTRAIHRPRCPLILPWRVTAMVAARPPRGPATVDLDCPHCLSIRRVA